VHVTTKTTRWEQVSTSLHLPCELPVVAIILATMLCQITVKQCLVGYDGTYLARVQFSPIGLPVDLYLD
jgi:hypothetical protein